MDKMERLNKRLHDKAVLDGLVGEGLMPADAVLMFVCTDRGQHPRATLGKASSSDGQPPYLWLPVGRQPGIDDTRGVHIETVEGRDIVHVRCPRCPRRKRWGEAKANERIRRLLAANLTELDISLI